MAWHDRPSTAALALPCLVVDPRTRIVPVTVPLNLVSGRRMIPGTSVTTTTRLPPVHSSRFDSIPLCALVSLYFSLLSRLCALGLGVSAALARFPRRQRLVLSLLVFATALGSGGSRERVGGVYRRLPHGGRPSRLILRHVSDLWESVLVFNIIIVCIRFAAFFVARACLMCAELLMTPIFFLRLSRLCDAAPCRFRPKSFFGSSIGLLLLCGMAPTPSCVPRLCSSAQASPFRKCEPVAPLAGVFRLLLMLREPEQRPGRNRKVVVEKAPASAVSKGDLTLVCGRAILTNEQVNILSVSVNRGRIGLRKVMRCRVCSCLRRKAIIVVVHGRDVS